MDIFSSHNHCAEGQLSLSPWSLGVESTLTCLNQSSPCQSQNSLNWVVMYLKIYHPKHWASLAGRRRFQLRSQHQTPQPLANLSRWASPATLLPRPFLNSRPSPCQEGTRLECVWTQISVAFLSDLPMDTWVTSTRMLSIHLGLTLRVPELEAG